MLSWYNRRTYMKVQTYKSSKWRIVRLSISFLIIAFAGYALFEVSASGVLPQKYIIWGIVGFGLWVALILFLLLRWFATRRRRIIARTGAIIMLTILLVVSSAGLYVLKRSLSTLDGLSNNANSITVNTNESFNVFISGIDTVGDISSQSRSDTNIVATVNPVTHKLLLTTIPRDSYVSIPLGGNDGMDKLTHAGIYGPEASMGAVSNLLNTEINAYVRINFTSFIKSIDTLGGITVNNPVEFTSRGETFPAGEITLDGDSALIYSRARKTLAGGDIDRGKNQQRVIQAVVDKITGIRTLGGFGAVLNLIGTSVDTNMSQATIRSLINRQLDTPAKWTTDNYTLKGKGQTGGLTSYAMPNARLYMYVLNDKSVTEATERISSLLQEK